MSELARFFAEMEPFLLGRKSAMEVEAALGPSPSGTSNLAFYRTLVDRNYHKIMRLLFPSVCTLARRVRYELWSDLVREYVTLHPPVACRNPNLMGAHFSEYLTRRREQRGELPVAAEELAEYHWVDYVAKTAEDVEGDGLERRLFIRQFTLPIPAYALALYGDPEAPPPEPRPTVVVVYRSVHDGNVAILYPSPATLAVLARRQGLQLPPALAALDERDVNLTEGNLVTMGVLTEASR